jgi:hypothetical protein
MKKSKLFLAAGGFVLALASIFATKANRKFIVITTAKLPHKFHNISSGELVTNSNGPGHWTSVKSVLDATVYLALITVNILGEAIDYVTLVTTVNGVNKVYYY